MGNPFVCGPLVGSSILLFFLILGWIILSVVLVCLVNYFGRNSNNNNYRTVFSVGVLLNVFLLVFGIIINSYSAPCGGNLFAALAVGINIYILYCLYTNKWVVTDNTYSQV